MRTPITGRGFCGATLTRIRARIHGAPTDAYGLVAQGLQVTPDCLGKDTRAPPRPKLTVPRPEGGLTGRTAGNVGQSRFQPAQQHPRRIVIATTGEAAMPASCGRCQGLFRSSGNGRPRGRRCVGRIAWVGASPYQGLASCAWVLTIGGKAAGKAAGISWLSPFMRGPPPTLCLTDKACVARAPNRFTHSVRGGCAKPWRGRAPLACNRARCAMALHRWADTGRPSCPADLLGHTHLPGHFLPYRSVMDRHTHARAMRPAGHSDRQYRLSEHLPDAHPAGPKSDDPGKLAAMPEPILLQDTPHRHREYFGYAEPRHTGLG